jgi:hypothetical protein
MGTARWDPTDWSAYAASTTGKTTDAVFASRAIDSDLNPFGVAVRESRDSDLNPESTAIIVGLDVTGSMGMIADALARKGLGTMVEEILARKPVSDPHILCMGIGDVLYDRAPLQVTQFEADIRIAKQLEKLWLEKGGGGNSCESYTLPWYFAALHTARSTASRSAARKAICSRSATRSRRRFAGRGHRPLSRRPAAARFRFPRIADPGQPHVPRLSRHRRGRLARSPRPARGAEPLDRTARATGDRPVRSHQTGGSDRVRDRGQRRPRPGSGDQKLVGEDRLVVQRAVGGLSNPPPAPGGAGVVTPVLTKRRGEQGERCLKPNRSSRDRRSVRR